MKKVLLYLVFVSLNLSLYSQNDFQFNQGEFGVELNVSGLINNTSFNTPNDGFGNPQLKIRYFLSDQVALVGGLGIQSTNTSFSIVDSVGTFQRQFDSTSASFNFFVLPGIERYFKASERLVPYVGAALSIGALGKNKRSSTTRFIDTTGTRTIEITDDLPGGFQFGVMFTVGAQYFVAKKLSLGASYQFGYFYQRTGGDYNRVVVDQPITGASRIDRNIGSNLTSNRGFSFPNTANLTLSYYFSL